MGNAIIASSIFSQNVLNTFIGQAFRTLAAEESLEEIETTVFYKIFTQLHSSLPLTKQPLHIARKPIALVNPFLMVKSPRLYHRDNLAIHLRPNFLEYSGLRHMVNSWENMRNGYTLFERDADSTFAAFHCTEKGSLSLLLPCH